MYQLKLGNSLELLKTLEENSVDSIVTDPPYELGFMGKSWDKTGIANNVELWKECLRVLKPGGHLLAFSGTRTYHRMASAIEDAGFEIRDMIAWVYASGFPKSLNIGKAVDKLQGNEREELGDMKPAGFKTAASGYTDTKAWSGKVSKGTSEWEGWGTSLKPSHEPICMARKPLAEKNVAQNVLKYGTGGINIDESRVEGTYDNEGRNIRQEDYKSEAEFLTALSKEGRKTRSDSNPLGRFPANLIHDNSEEVRECFPETNASKSANRGLQHSGRHGGLADIGGNIKDGTDTVRGHDDNGGNASRFFKSIIYQAKASKKDRGEGNKHPTVKPTPLMEYLVTMVTKKGGVVLDPFNGSGSTGVACVKNGFDYIGIDLSEEYLQISEKRIQSLNN